jgi:hypothetical protein
VISYDTYIYFLCQGANLVLPPVFNLHLAEKCLHRTPRWFPADFRRNRKVSVTHWFVWKLVIEVSHLSHKMWPFFYRWSIKFSWIFSNFSRFFPCFFAPARDYSCYSFLESSRAPGSESPARTQNGHELPRTEQNFQKWMANPMSATASAHRFTTFSRACAQRPSKSAVVSRDEGNSCRQIRAISM